jgi:hypothetical protein
VPFLGKSWASPSTRSEQFRKRYESITLFFCQLFPVKLKMSDDWPYLGLKKIITVIFLNQNSTAEPREINPLASLWRRRRTRVIYSLPRFSAFNGKFSAMHGCIQSSLTYRNPTLRRPW